MAATEQSMSIGPSLSPEIHFIVQNINGYDSKGRSQRRSLIATFLSIAKWKPDFLAFQDGVRWVDLVQFIETLGHRYPGSRYSHIAEKGVGNIRKKGVKPTSLYKDNREALVYDDAIWELLDNDEDVLRQKEFNSYRDLLSCRFRAGKFRHRKNKDIVFVVSYHGRWRKGKKKNMEIKLETRENCFKEFLETIIRKLNSQNPDASLFICGDFNFCLERTVFKQYLQNKGVEILPKMYNRLSDSDGCTNRKLPIDYVLVRGPNIQVESHEFSVLSPLPGGDSLNSVKEEPETTSRCALVDKSLEDVDLSENKCEVSIKKEPSLKFGKPHGSKEVDIFAETKPRRLFDHNGIHVHVKFGLIDQFEKETSGKSEIKLDWSIDDFPWKAYRSTTASVLISIKTRERLRKSLWSEDSIMQGDIWIMVYYSVSTEMQKQLYNAVRSIRRKWKNEIISIRFENS